MKPIVFFFLFLFTISTQAQTVVYEQFTVTGTVTDAATQQPMAGASVFCQNTTLGAITNAEGKFVLKVPAGGYDLIISYTSYETQEMRINTASLAPIAVALKLKDKSLAEVAVVGSSEVADGLVKYGQFFKDNFIGTTSNAKQCTIQNPEALQFYFSKKRNRLRVKAKEDLIIVNHALGYKIKFQLDSFSYDYNTNISAYTGFPFFEQLEGDAAQTENWKQNREEAYAGSRLHFLRSWYDSTLQQEGYILEYVDPNSKTLKTTPVKNLYDSSMYAVIENNDVEITYGGRLRIIYKEELPDANYLSTNKLPAYLKSQITIIDVNDGFVIQQNGYFYDQNDVTNTGYWSWEKLGDALPYDYNPE